MGRSRKRLRVSKRLLLAWALGVATTGCTHTYAGRWIVWNRSGVEDHLRFPSRPVEAAPAPFRFTTARAPAPRVEVERRGRTRVMDLEELGRTTSTTALIVVRRDTIVFEGYFSGHDSASIVTSFSIAKSITSLLVGIALDRGHISSVDDPVTAYLPELAERDERFGRLTLAHLLDMRSGLRWRDHDFVTGDKPRAYYHPRLRQLVLTWLPFVGDPGHRWVYNSFNPIVLGLALERTTDGSVAGFLTEALWRRIGTEYPASWSVDGERDPMEKMESGVNARAIDFVKLGRLVLAGGAWDGERVVSREWLDESTRVEPGCELEAYRPRRVCYRRAWWLYPADGDEPRAVAATGHLGQYLFVFPDQEVVIVRFGRKPGGVHWPTVFRSIVRALEVDGVA
jgi:CubicO group peptidase (beta-lactamase class C family)